MVFPRNILLTFNLGNEYHYPIDYEINKKVIADVIEYNTIKMKDMFLTVDNNESINDISISNIVGTIRNICVEKNLSNDSMCLLGDIKIIDTEKGRVIKNMLETNILLRFYPLMFSEKWTDDSNYLIKKIAGFNINMDFSTDKNMPYVGYRMNELIIDSNYVKELDDKIQTYLKINDYV
jgi:hypothetical protein